MYKADTIAAVATPPGEGGVAMVRLSGPDAKHIGREILAREDLEWESHRLYYGKVRDPARGSLVDEVMFAFLQGPRSYTGEDTVEIHCHGGPFVVRQLLGLVLGAGSAVCGTRRVYQKSFFEWTVGFDPGRSRVGPDPFAHGQGC